REPPSTRGDPMTTLSQGNDTTATGSSRGAGFMQSSALTESNEVNVGQDERNVSLASGSLLLLLGLSRASLPGLVVAAVGGGLIYRGATGHCPMYSRFNLNTARDELGKPGRTAHSDMPLH